MCETLKRSSRLCATWKPLLWLASAALVAGVRKGAPSWMESCGTALQTVRLLLELSPRVLFVFFFSSVHKLVTGREVQPASRVLVFPGAWDSSRFHRKWFTRSQNYLDSTDLFFCTRFYAKVGKKCFYLAGELVCMLLHLSCVHVSSF